MVLFRALALVVLSIAQPAEVTTAADADCLFAGVSSSRPSDCALDPYHVATEPMLAGALGRLGVLPNQVTFYGCARGRFSTRMPGSGEFVISYPLSPPYDFDKYVGPLTHELGHVAQLQEAGSLAGLRSSLSRNSARIELGADFITGFMFRRYMNNLNQQQFEQSLDLLGNYASGPRASHGRPEARTAAFRMGFYYATAGVSLAAAHRDFQRNRFGGIVNEMTP